MAVFFAATLFYIERSDAQGFRRVQASLGSGFFVGTGGHLVTNAHVLEGCKQIHITGPVKSKKVEVIAVDEAIDLALLRVSERPKYAAHLRYNKGLKEGDQVMLLGYPGNAAVTGEYVIKTANIVDLKGPHGEEDHVQFTVSSEQGNSGGPLLDANGNVIGVVRAYVRYYSMDDPTITLKEADVAINMPVLRRFLDKHFVQYDSMISQDEVFAFQKIRPEYIEKTAKKFIAGVICLQEEV
jgi:S1-C subfamily serine protease